jgi:hypothetical protein
MRFSGGTGLTSDRAKGFMGVAEISPLDLADVADLHARQQAGE